MLESPRPGVHFVDGRQFPLSRAGLAAAIDELPADGGVIVVPPNCPIRFESPEPVLILRDNVTLLGHPSSRISGPLHGDCVMISPYGEQGSAVALSADASRGDTVVRLASSLEVSTGATILIRDLSDGHTHVSVVVDATDSNRPQFADPLSDAFVAASSEAYRLTVRQNLTVRLWLDGSGCSGSVTGFGANYTRHSRYEINAANFNSANSCGAYDNYGYGNYLTGIFTNCGNVNNALGYSSSAMEVMHSTRETVRDVQIVNSIGFGFSSAFTNHSLLDNIATSYTRGHGMKIGGSTQGSQCADLRIANCAISYVGIEPSSGTGESGLCYTAGSHDVSETNCVIKNCGWHGVEIYTADVCRIVSTNLVSVNNGLVNPGVDIATWGHSLRYVAPTFRTRADRATGTLWDGAFSEGELNAVAAGCAPTATYRKAIAGHTLAPGRSLHLEMTAFVFNPTFELQALTLALMFEDAELVSLSVTLAPTDGPSWFEVQARVDATSRAGEVVAILSSELSAPASGSDWSSSRRMNGGKATLDYTRQAGLSLYASFDEGDVGLCFQPESARLLLSS